MVSIGAIGANFADMARAAIVNPLAKGAAGMAQQAAAIVVQNAMKKAATTNVANPNASAAPAGIPKPVLIGGIAAVAIVGLLVIAKKKKR